MEGRIAFMAGLKIENLAEASLPATARAENLATREPTYENKLIGSGNIKILAVHFFNGQAEMSRYSLSDGMSGVNAPESLSVAVTPAEIAGRAHKLFEYL